MLAAARTTRADTVDIVHDGYGAYGATTFWAAGHNGNDIMSGVYLLNKTSGTGTGNTWSNGLIPGFCIEIQEPHPTATYTYDVRMPEDVYNNYTGQYLGTTKANYLRELWARYYDPAWTSGSYTAQQNSDAQAFAAAIWEIVYEKMPVSPAQWDVTIDGTMGLGGFRAENLDWETANQWLHSLTGGQRQGGSAGLRQRRPPGVPRRGARAGHGDPARPGRTGQRVEPQTQTGGEQAGITTNTNVELIYGGSLPMAARARQTTRK